MLKKTILLLFVIINTSFASHQQPPKHREATNFNATGNPLGIPRPGTVIRHPQRRQRVLQDNPIHPLTMETWYKFNGDNQPAPYNRYDYDFSSRSSFFNAINNALYTFLPTQAAIEQEIADYASALYSIQPTYPDAHERSIKAYRQILEENLGKK